MQSKKKRKTRKGTFGFGQLAGAGLGVVIFIAVVAMGALLLNGMQENVDNTTDAYTIIGDGITALGTFGDWTGLIVLIVVMVVIISIILAYFGGYLGGRGGGGTLGA